MPAWWTHGRGNMIAAMGPQAGPPARTPYRVGFSISGRQIGESDVLPLQMSGSSTVRGILQDQERSGTTGAPTVSLDAAVPPVGRGRPTTMPAWISAGIGMNTPALGGLQQQEALGTPRRREIADPPSSPIVGRRRGRSNSGDRHSLRPRSRSRHQSPASHHGDPGRDTRGGGGNRTQEETLLVGIRM